MMNQIVCGFDVRGEGETSEATKGKDLAAWMGVVCRTVMRAIMKLGMHRVEATLIISLHFLPDKN